MGFSHTRVWLNYKSRGVTHVTYREYNVSGLGVYYIFTNYLLFIIDHSMYLDTVGYGVLKQTTLSYVEQSLGCCQFSKISNEIWMHLPCPYFVSFGCLILNSSV
jgi:hypothetical protein